MKIYLVQMNSKVGDFDGNKAKMADALNRSDDDGLVVFPECSLTGYPQQDLLDYKAFATKASEAAEDLIRAFPKKSFVFGNIERNTDKGRPFRNVALFVKEGQLVGKYFKRLLPSYDVFDEDRFFEPGREPLIVEFGGTKFGITICEDIWSHDLGPYLQNRYLQNPVADCADADILLNLSSSPFEYRKVSSKREMLSRIAKTYQKPLIYVNSVGANDSIIFDGRSYIWNEKGELCVEFPAFAEGLGHVNLRELSPEQITPTDEISDIYDALILGIRDYCQKTGFQQVVLGLSGGIDSALVNCLASDAIGAQNVTVVMLPSRYTSAESNQDALSMAVRMQNPLHILSIEEMFASGLLTLEKAFEGQAPDFTEENLQARIRGALLMALANKFRMLLLTTGNKSELAVGYCTLYGDMNGALAPICDVYKSQVYKLAEEANRRQNRIPERIFQRPPTAELRLNQKDQDSLPDYAILDAILEKLIDGHLTRDELLKEGFEPEDVNKVVMLYSTSEHKRYQMPLGLKVSSKAFGVGRRMPLVHSFY